VPVLWRLREIPLLELIQGHNTFLYFVMVVCFSE
jgi:hypothetical protein